MRKSGRPSVRHGHRDFGERVLAGLHSRAGEPVSRKKTLKLPSDRRRARRVALDLLSAGGEQPPDCCRIIGKSMRLCITGGLSLSFLDWRTRTQCGAGVPEALGEPHQ